jgi:glycosyltransferase involved in cell wall biosynthesis
MTIFTITYNEELMLPYFIKHYRSRFAGCKIVVYDNESTDKTVEIARYYNCEVITYSTNNKLSDTKYLEIKNNCWKNENGWVIVADCDEFLDVRETDLKNETATIISVEAYNMVNNNNDLNIDNIKHGVRSTSYDKAYCFNASKLAEINYSPGCHTCEPIPNATYSPSVYRAYHYKYINLDYMIKRHSLFAGRLSEENIKRGYGGHYLYTPEQIEKEFNEAIINSKQILRK